MMLHNPSLPPRSVISPGKDPIYIQNFTVLFSYSDFVTKSRVMYRNIA